MACRQRLCIRSGGNSKRVNVPRYQTLFEKLNYKFTLNPPLIMHFVGSWPFFTQLVPINSNYLSVGRTYKVALSKGVHRLEKYPSPFLLIFQSSHCRFLEPSSPCPLPELQLSNCCLHFLHTNPISRSNITNLLHGLRRRSVRVPQNLCW